MLDKENYLKKYVFDWDVIDTVVSGKSPIDSKFFVADINSKEVVNDFLRGYGLEPSDPIIRAELFGNFQEALQFIKRYCLKEGNEDGIDLKIPNTIYMITDIDELFLLAAKKTFLDSTERQEGLWAEVILKFMHTLLHMDKDLRSNYFSTIQTQVFDRFYKYIFRDENNSLFLGKKGERDNISLLDFNTKSKKTRDSVLIKLLHKPENVAEELFDRVGVRFITKNKFDTLRVVRYLLSKNIVIPHNIKPSRSLNTLFDINSFKVKYNQLIKNALKLKLDESSFVSKVIGLLEEKREEKEAGRNDHSLSKYRAIHFTGRNLIKYKNPFFSEFLQLRKMAKADPLESNKLAKKILSMDSSLITKEVKFFYPFEVQILDEKSHLVNTEGEASHQVYKKNQLRAVIKRIFGSLMEENQISL
ncbi:TIGR04552 family protein [bacterium]|nr:TIGR04552 family protein [bacterium]